MMPRRHGVACLLLGAFVFFATGCGDSRPPAPTTITSGANPGTGGSGGTGAVPGPDCASVDGPTVTIMTPTPTLDASSADVLVTRLVSISCQIDAGTSPVSEESVVVTVTDALGLSLTPSLTNLGGGLYEGVLDTDTLAAGAVTIICYAEDTEETALCNQDSFDTLLDHGPAVEITQPNTNPSIQSGSMTINFTAVGESISEDDAFFDIDTMELVVAGAPIVPVCDPETNECTAIADFNDRTLYPTVLDGENQFTLTVTNQRGAVNEIIYDFIVDSTPPSISYVMPIAGEVVGGSTPIEVIVTDDSGIRLGGVSFVIRNSEQGSVMERVPGTSTYTGTFDANQYPTTVTEVTIDVTAFDEPGNLGERSISVKLDGVPPIVDLDPPYVRQGKDGDDGVECSAAFDPVGSGSADDGEIVGSLHLFRARAEDRTNTPLIADETSVVVTQSGVDPAGVQLYFLDDINGALVVDTNADGICDEINPAYDQGNSEGNEPAIFIDLRPVAPTGAAYFPPDQDFSELAQSWFRWFLCGLLPIRR